jgi:hypothetical protein
MIAVTVSRELTGAARRPTFDPEVRAAISSLATGASDVSLARLADDLRTGAWERKHGRVLEQDAVDLGYRLVVAMDRSTQDGIIGSRAKR